MTITGYKELHDKLSAMGKAVGGKILREAVRAAVKPVVDSAKANAPVGNPPYSTVAGDGDPYPIKDWKGRYRVPGYTSRNIVARARLSRDGLLASVRVGPLSSAFYSVNYHEFGTSKIPKRPWLEPALRSNLGNIDVRLKAEIVKRIDKAARKK